MNILVLGATGMAGHLISHYFLERGHSVTTYTRRPFDLGRNITGDISDPVFLHQLLHSDNYDAVINCIGILNQNAENDKPEAVFFNSYLPHQIVAHLTDTPTRYIHLSTDCVFSGETGPYYENSLRDGATFYDRSKALGEVDDSKNLTIRTSIIGPDLNPSGIGLFNWFMGTGLTPIQGYEKAIWTGVTTLTMAKAIEAALTQNLSSIYHLVNNESINKFELLKLFNQQFKDGAQTITPSDSLVVDKALVNTRTDFDFTVPSYTAMISEMRAWIEIHADLYPHYCGSHLTGSAK